MRHASASPAETNVPRTQRGDWATIRTLLPYLWEYKGRVLAAIACLVLAKVANVGVPVLLKQIVDSLDRADGGAGRAARAAGRLRPAAAVHDAVHRAARVPVREGDAARGAQDRAAGVPPPARAVAALPPAPADRRADARRRARPARHLHADQLRAVLDPAHAGRDHAGVGDPDRALRLDVHGDHRRRARDLHRVHRAHHRVAHAFPAHDERARLARPTRARSTACSTTRRSSISATRSGRRAATTRACSAGRRRR